MFTITFFICFFLGEAWLLHFKLILPTGTLCLWFLKLFEFSIAFFEIRTLWSLWWVITTRSYLKYPRSILLSGIWLIAIREFFPSRLIHNLFTALNKLNFVEYLVSNTGFNKSILVRAFLNDQADLVHAFFQDIGIDCGSSSWYPSTWCC
jgi:hypothetical protein